MGVGVGEVEKKERKKFLILSELFPELYSGFCAASVLHFHRNELKRGNLSDFLSF